VFKGLLRSGEGTAEWREQQRRERKDERGRGKRVRDGDEREGVDFAPVAPPLTSIPAGAMLVCGVKILQSQIRFVRFCC